MAVHISLIEGDITKTEADAIVNAANERLTPGGGVSGAIHAAAGSELAEECRHIGFCPTGQARLTSAYKLKAKYVIHAVGPVFRGGEEGEAAQLRDCYLASMKLAREHGAKSIAFPSISTGIFGYPKEQAAEIAVNSILNAPDSGDSPVEVIFVTFDQKDYNIYARLLSKPEK